MTEARANYIEHVLSFNPEMLQALAVRAFPLNVTFK